MDDRLKHQNDLAQWIAALQDTWTFLLSKNDGFQNDEIKAMQEMDEMVQRLVAEMDTAAREVFDNTAQTVEAMKRRAEQIKAAIKERPGRAADVVEGLIEILKRYVVDEIKPDGFPDGADSPMEAGLSQLELMIEVSAERVKRYRELLGTYRDLLELQKGTVLTKFNRTRAQIDGYLSTNNIGQARVWLDQAKGQLRAWASALPTSGQQSDGAQVCCALYDQLDHTSPTTLDLDNLFTKRFEGAFLSPVSNETVEVLAQGYLFSEQLGKIKSKEAWGKLDEVRKVLPERVNSIEESTHSMDETIAELPGEVQDLARSGNKDFQQYVHDRFRRQMDLLLPNIDELKRLLDPSTWMLTSIVSSRRRCCIDFDQ